VALTGVFIAFSAISLVLVGSEMISAIAPPFSNPVFYRWVSLFFLLFFKISCPPPQRLVDLGLPLVLLLNIIAVSLPPPVNLLP